MTGPASLAPTIRLMTWLSPAFPLGAFAYSHGLETLFETADLTNRASFEDWLTDMISEGTGWSDAVLCAQAWATAPEDAAALSDLASLAESLCATAERHEETLAQGRAFLNAIAQTGAKAGAGLVDQAALPVALGSAARLAGLDQGLTVSAYLNAYATNLVQAALRMGRFGQGDGAAIVARLEPLVIETAGRACQAGRDDLGTSTLLADLAAIHHETLEPRVFIS